MSEDSRRLLAALVEIDTYLANDPDVWRIVSVSKVGDVLCDVLGAETILAINAQVQSNLTRHDGHTASIPQIRAHKRASSFSVSPSCFLWRNGGSSSVFRLLVWRSGGVGYVSDSLTGLSNDPPARDVQKVRPAASAPLGAPSLDPRTFDAEASMPLTAAKGAKKRADDLFSKLVRSRGFCEGCGSTQNLQTCHIISRRYSATRTDLANAVCGCASCHRYWTDHPVDFAAFITRHIGLDEYEALSEKSQGREKMNWAAEVERLKAIYAAVNQ